MKRFLYLLIILLIVCAFAILLVRMNMSSIASYALGKVTGGKVHISKVEFGYRDGFMVIELSDMSMGGNIEGNVKRWKFSVQVKKGLYFKDIAIAGFDLNVLPGKGKMRFFSFPAELLEIKDGSVTYNSQRFVIHEFTISNLNIGKPFAFSADVSGGYYGSLKASGEGVYKDSLLDIKGKYSIGRMDMDVWYEKMKGKADISGEFTYTKKKFTMDGPFELTHYTLKDRILKKPLLIEKIKGNMALSHAGGITDLKIHNVFFKDTPFLLTLKIENSELTKFGFSSEFFSMKDVKEYIALEGVTKTSPNIWSFVREGKARMNRLTYEKKHPLHAEIELKNVGIAYKEMYFNNVEGILLFDESKIDVSHVRGIFKASTFYDFAGVIPLGKDSKLKIRGGFSVNLKDIPSMLDVGDLKFRKGISEGIIELEGNESEGYTMKGTGKLHNVDLLWRKVSVSARGSYRFTSDEIVFDPLIINQGGTDIVIRGRWNKKYMGMHMKGDLDIHHVEPFIKVPFDMYGIATLDINIRKEDDVLKVGGDILMNDLYFEIPGIIKKDKGIESSSHFNIFVEEKKKDVMIEHLFYNIDGIDIRLKGRIEEGRYMNLDVSMNVIGIERVAPLFFFEGDTARGDAELKLSVRNFSLPLKKLPYMRGYIKIHNGFLRLPWIAKPLKEINLKADFKGETFDIEVSKLKCGISMLNKGQLHVENFDSPRFSLSLDMETFNIDDVQDVQDEFEFRIPLIDKNSIMANVSGDISLKTKDLRLNRVRGEYLEANGLLMDRKLSVAGLKMDTFGGHVDMRGAIDLSGATPYMYANGSINEIASSLFLQSFPAKNHAIDGHVTFYGSLDAEGASAKELLNGVNGNMTMYSKDGVIKRWNLLSKIFGLLNFYDLFRGKVDFMNNGLSYKKMGANFTLKNGVFHTNNFIIDSPSMLIIGEGDLDIKKKTINGNITVSPLITLDRTIDKIPILRSIVKEKSKGFLYAAYNVKGPLDDPDISVSFVNSIGRKTFEILKNIFILPKKVFE
jgi:hypothetical protein